MGSSTYRDEEYEPRRKKQSQKRTPMEEVISRMTAVEKRRKELIEAKEGLTNAENKFIEAEEELRRSEAQVREEINRLDPESQRMLRAMLNKLNETDRHHRDEER